MTAPLLPVQQTQRIHYMDALRGVALLGIFIINLTEGFLIWRNTNTHTGPWFTGFDENMGLLQTLLIEGKFYSLFSLLFGWGLALQWQRLQDKGIGSVALLRRRLLIMLLLGGLHIMLVWTGDIILLYSLLGFVLLAMRNASDKKLVYGGVALILSPILLYYLKMRWGWVNWPVMQLNGIARDLDIRLNGIRTEEEMRIAFQRPTYGSLLKMNTAGFFYRYADLLFSSRMPKVLGMFMIGFYLGLNGNYRRFLDNNKRLRLLFAAGLLIGIPFNYWHAVYAANQSGYYDLTIKGWYKTVLYALGVAPLAVSYAAGLALFFQTRIGRSLATFVQPVGKMAFSNYVLQSIVGTVVFYGIGWGLMDQVGLVYSTIFAIAVFILQALLSRWWLSHFAYGPIEWLWRSLTYKKAQPVRKPGLAL